MEQGLGGQVISQWVQFSPQFGARRCTNIFRDVLYIGHVGMDMLTLLDLGRGGHSSHREGTLPLGRQLVR